MRKHWYCLFLLLGFVLALFPPTTVTRSMPITFNGQPTDLTSSAETKFRWVLSSVPLGPTDAAGYQTDMRRDWPTLLTLEVLCLTGFLFFGLRRPT